MAELAVVLTACEELKVMMSTFVPLVEPVTIVFIVPVPSAATLLDEHLVKPNIGMFVKIGSKFADIVKFYFYLLNVIIIIIHFSYSRIFSDVNIDDIIEI